MPVAQQADSWVEKHPAWAPVTWIHALRKRTMTAGGKNDMSRKTVKKPAPKVRGSSSPKPLSPEEKAEIKKILDGGIAQPYHNGDENGGLRPKSKIY